MGDFRGGGDWKGKRHPPAELLGFQNGPRCFLKSLSKRSPGAAKSNLRPGLGFVTKTIREIGDVRGKGKSSCWATKFRIDPFPL